MPRLRRQRRLQYSTLRRSDFLTELSAHAGSFERARSARFVDDLHGLCFLAHPVGPRRGKYPLRSQGDPPCSSLFSNSLPSQQAWPSICLYFGRHRSNASLNKRSAWYAAAASNAKRQPHGAVFLPCSCTFEWRQCPTAAFLNRSASADAVQQVTISPGPSPRCFSLA
jgi:hypothetical protein